MKIMQEPSVRGEVPGLHSIYFYLTKGCNLRCCHCWIAPQYQEKAGSLPALELGLFKDIVEQAIPLGLSSIKLTGGEPLLHPEIHRILEFIGLKKIRLGIETNGTLCTSAIASQIARHQNCFVSVSLDGPNFSIHERIRKVAGSFEAAKCGIRNLVEAGIRPQIIMSVMRHNKDCLEDTIRLAESLGAGSVKFNFIMPIARGEEVSRNGQSLSIEEMIGVQKQVEGLFSACAKIPLTSNAPPAFRSLKNMFDERAGRYSRCGIFHILGVLGDGSYALCGIGETTPELIFGNANTDSLKDVWNNSLVLKRIREGIPDRLKGICGACLMKRVCLGNCVAFNYYYSKDVLAEFWFCARAYEAGAFPVTRLNQNNAAMVTPH